MYMINNLNIFLSDNSYLNDFFPIKEKSPNRILEDSILNLDVCNEKGKKTFNFYGIEDYRVWRESFVPIAQGLKEKNSLNEIIVNFFNFLPNKFQISFCKDNNIKLCLNFNNLSNLKDTINSNIENINDFLINYYISNSNSNDIKEILKEYSNRDFLNISFKFIKNLSSKNEDLILSELKNQKDKILKGDSKLIPNNFAYYISADILSLKDIKIGCSKKKSLYIDNNLELYELNISSDAFSKESLIGKIENNKLMFRVFPTCLKKEIGFNCDCSNNSNSCSCKESECNQGISDSDEIKNIITRRKISKEMSNISNDLFFSIKRNSSLNQIYSIFEYKVKYILNKLEDDPNNILYTQFI